MIKNAKCILINNNKKYKKNKLFELIKSLIRQKGKKFKKYRRKGYIENAK